MKSKVLLVVLNTFIYASCASNLVRGSAESQKIISIKDLDGVKLGATKQLVKSVLGEPNEVSPPTERVHSDSWVYRSNVGDPPWQRGEVSFDIHSSLVISKSFMPLEGENEESLEFLLQQKFAHHKFEELPLKRCKRDFVPAEVFYINISSGIVIRFDRYRKYVESITWQTSARAANEIDLIKNCKK